MSHARERSDRAGGGCAIATLWGYSFVLFIVKPMHKVDFYPHKADGKSWNKVHCCVLFSSAPKRVALASPHTHTHTHTHTGTDLQPWTSFFSRKFYTQPWTYTSEFSRITMDFFCCVCEF